MEVQAVAGRPFLPHVYVLPHGSVSAAEHRAEPVSTPTCGTKTSRPFEFQQMDEFMPGFAPAEFGSVSLGSALEPTKLRQLCKLLQFGFG